MRLWNGPFDTLSPGEFGLGLFLMMQIYFFPTQALYILDLVSLTIFKVSRRFCDLLNLPTNVYVPVINNFLVK